MRRMICGLALLAAASITPVCVSAGEQEDKQVATEIATILRDSGRMKDYSVGVKYKDGNVWLAGRVSSKEQMAAALEVVSDIEGVNQIVNNLTVGPAPAAKTAGKSPAKGQNVQLATAQQAAPQASTRRRSARPPVPAPCRLVIASCRRRR